MADFIKRASEAINTIPHDSYAVLFMVFGCVLILTGHKDEGNLLIGGGLSVFKGQQ